MKNPVIVEFPSNLGLKPPSSGKEPGVRKLPAWLRTYGFHDRLNASAILHLEPPAYEIIIDSDSGVRNVDSIIEYAQQQSTLLMPILKRNQLPIVIGGDCSILIGAALALNQLGNYGLFYLDGHTDFMRPHLSETGGAAGMDLAIIAGYGHDKLTNIQQRKPYLKEENIFCVGNREYDPDYVGEITQTDVHYIDLNTLREYGINNCLQQFQQMIDANNLTGFWLHIDVDVLDPVFMPAVDSPDPGGLNYSEFKQILRSLLSHQLLAGVEITILDPDLDPTGKYTNDFIEAFLEAWNHSIS